MRRFAEIFLAVFFLGGCAASGVKFSDSPYSTQVVAGDKARIIVYRESDINLGPVTIGIDGSRIGAVAHRGFIATDLAPGDYAISAWKRGLPLWEFVLKMRVAAGETYYLRASHRIEPTLYPLLGPVGWAAFFLDRKGEFQLDEVTAAVALPTLTELKLSE